VPTVSRPLLLVAHSSKKNGGAGGMVERVGSAKAARKRRDMMA